MAACCLRPPGAELAAAAAGRRWPPLALLLRSRTTKLMMQTVEAGDTMSKPRTSNLEPRTSNWRPPLNAPSLRLPRCPPSPLFLSLLPLSPLCCCHLQAVRSPLRSSLSSAMETAGQEAEGTVRRSTQVLPQRQGFFCSVCDQQGGACGRCNLCKTKVWAIDPDAMVTEHNELFIGGSWKPVAPPRQPKQ